ncbi:hypothetical protein [Sinorhizobium sp. NFACC03]|uniref:hypothetical protein n=1 Tax=Sinorhizobium sp. NFACC03 TaxID=1566295 RepID=UPI00088AB2E4|nr:hypothetical protein [Sinorhizobium sp. NFACC03]SDA73104.1 hypothetical protein SAMN03159448_02581 [Sinorhizobium sp. NFACC03]
MPRHHILVATSVAAFLGAITLFDTGSAQAQNLCPGVSADQCTDFCGAAGVASCTKTGSTPDCVCNETTKDVNGNANGTATQEEASGQGNIGNKTEEACTGNTGQCKKQ